MTFLEAAETALKQIGHPMRPNEMVALALKNAWLGPVGKTSVDTMRGQLGIQVKKSSSRFVRVAPGVFGLKEITEQRPSQPDLFEVQQNKERL